MINSEHTKHLTRKALHREQHGHIKQSNNPNTTKGQCGAQLPLLQFQPRLHMLLCCYHVMVAAGVAVAMAAAVGAGGVVVVVAAAAAAADAAAARSRVRLRFPTLNAKFLNPKP